MADRDFHLLAVMPYVDMVQVYSCRSGKKFNSVLYEKNGVKGFNFLGKWHALEDCIESDTVIKNWGK